MRSSKPKRFSDGLGVLQSAGVLRRWRKQEATAADFPTEAPEEDEEETRVDFRTKKEEEKGFRRRCFPPGSGRSFAPAGILELRLPGSASSRTSDCECSQMDGSSNHRHRLFSYGGCGPPTLPSPNTFYRPSARWTRDANASGSGKCSAWRARLSKDSRVASSTHLSSRVMDCLKLKVLR